MKPMTVWVNPNVYCSSTCHHFVDIHIKHGDRWLDICLSSSGLTYKHKRRSRFGQREQGPMPRRLLPAYVWAAVADALANVESSEWTFYEFDRDLNKRDTDLRYHHRPTFDGLVEWAIPYIRNYNKGK